MRDLLITRPFRPLVLHVADGRQLDLRHPELATLLPGGRTLLLITPDRSSHLIDVFMVTGVELKEAVSPEQLAPSS